MTRVVRPFDPFWHVRPIVRRAKTCEGCGAVCDVDVRFREQWKICPSCAATRLRVELAGGDTGAWPS